MVSCLEGEKGRGNKDGGFVRGGEVKDGSNDHKSNSGNANNTSGTTPIITSLATLPASSNPEKAFKCNMAGAAEGREDTSSTCSGADAEAEGSTDMDGTSSSDSEAEDAIDYLFAELMSEEIHEGEAVAVAGAVAEEGAGGIVSGPGQGADGAVMFWGGTDGIPVAPADVNNVPAIISI